MQRIKFQLYEGIGAFPRGPMITASGGVVYVAAVGDAAKQAITDEDGTSLTNPRTLTTGGTEFYVPDSVASVDLYIQAPGGQFVVRKGVVPGQEPDIAVDVSVMNQTMVIPFAIGDTTAATETDTGFDEPEHALFLPTPFLDILTVDATESIDVGTDSGDSGDADGFLDVSLVSVAGLVRATLLAAGQTLGGLLRVDESGGDLVPEAHVSGSKSITYTLTAGSDTAEGFIYLPYLLAAA